MERKTTRRRFLGFIAGSVIVGLSRQVFAAPFAFIKKKAAPPAAPNLWTWGRNAMYQLGLGHTTTRSAPTVVGTGTNWTKIAAAGSHVMAIKTDGTLWAWGANNYANIGDGTTVDKSSPIQIGSDNNWAQVSGTFGSLGIKTDGTLWSWGHSSGLLYAPRSFLADVSKVGVGSFHFLAVKTDGTLWSWGSNSDGQLGTGTTSWYPQFDPVQIGSGTDWAEVSNAHTSTSYAIKANGTLWVWGNNSGGQFGDGTTVGKSSPIQIGALTDWAHVVGGPGFALALKTDGTLWAWGTNTHGQLGDGTTVAKNSPIQIGADTTWAKIAVGSAFACAVKTDGTLWAWGNNSYGQLGTGNLTHQFANPVKIGAATNWSAISAGNYFSVALKTPS